MVKRLTALVLVLVSIGFSAAEARDFDTQTLVQKRRNDYNGDFRRKHNYPRNKDEIDAEQNFIDSQNSPQGDNLIVAAVERRRRVDFVQGSGMVVVKLLADDNDGLRHQKWVVRLSNGATMQAVYNVDMDGCGRVPLKVGDVVAMGGMFIYTNVGPMLHWLHYDPRKNRPDGYVELNGKFYCKNP